MTLQRFPEFVDRFDGTVRAAQARAKTLAQHGIPVFPVCINKTPACAHGFKDATTELVTIDHLWEKYPAPLIGVPTGVPSGFDAFDIDSRHGGDKWLAANAGAILATRIHQTRSGGWHYFFQHHVGLKNSAGRIAEGIDVRAEGGYVIWWPAAGLPVLSDIAPAPWPDWLLALALTPPRQFDAPITRLQDISNAYINGALHRAVDTIANASDGTRNTILNQQAWSLMRFAQSGGIGAQEIAATLYAAARAAGLDHREIISTIASVIRSRGLA